MISNSDTAHESLLIHIGTHKTGTTAINRFLKGNNKNLANQKACIVELSPKFRSLAKSIPKINEADVGKHSEELSNELHKLIDKQRGRRGKLFNKFFIIWEGFSGSAKKGYPENARLASALQKATSDCKVNTRIIMYIRRQDDFISSMYTQIVRDGESKDILEYIEQLPPDNFNWYKLANNYSNSFGKKNLIIEPYGRTFFPGRNDILINFCRHAQLNPDKLEFENYKRSLQSNQGWPRHIVEIARLLNRRLDKAAQRKMRSIFDLIASKETYENYEYFNKKDRIALMKRFTESNSLLAREYLPSSSSCLFPEAEARFADNPDQTKFEPSQEDFLETLQGMLNNSQITFLNDSLNNSKPTNKAQIYNWLSQLFSRATNFLQARKK